MKKKRKQLKKDHDLEDNASFSRLSSDPTIKMPDGEMVSEQEWKRRFDSEWYYAERYKSFEIMTTKEQKQEAQRNNNNNKRDALARAEKYGQLHELSANETEFMEAASDEWDWTNVYKISGYEDAAHLIYEQAIRDIKAGTIDFKITLTRFYIKLKDLKTLKRREYK